MSRRRLGLVVLAALATALILGRLVAQEIAEHFWAQTFELGEAYLQLRWRQGATRLTLAAIAAAWLVANLFILFRAVRSIQLPRRLGNLVIAEAVSPRILFVAATLIGVALAVGATAGTGDWWIARALSLEAPRFDLVEPTLGNDAGYYAAELPWQLAQQRFARRLIVLALILALGFYAGIGSIRLSGGKLFATDHARRHLAAVGALAAGLAGWMWSVLGDTAVAGLSGSSATESLQLQITAATLLPVFAGLAALATATWIVWSQAWVPMAGWGVLGVVWVVFRVTTPFAADGTARDSPDPEFVQAAFDLDYQILGPVVMGVGSPDSADVLRTAVRGIPLWDREMLQQRFAATDQSHALADLDLELDSRPGSAARWVGVPEPAWSRLRARGQLDWQATHHGDWARTAPPITLGNTESGTDSVGSPTPGFVIAPGLGTFSLVDDGPGIDLSNPAARAVLAWALQSVKLLNATGRLLWRRTPLERLQRVAPFADFRDPYLVSGEQGALWVLDGYTVVSAFPRVPATTWAGGAGAVRHARADFLATVGPRTGEVRVYLSPNAGPLGRAWARIAAGLVQPMYELPAWARQQLRYPETLFRVQVALAGRQAAEAWSQPLRLPPGGWSRRLSWLVGSLPGDSATHLWAAVPFESGSPPRYRALLAGTRRDGTPRLVLLRLAGVTQLPTTPALRAEPSAGVRHVWPIGGSLYTQEASYTHINPSLPAISVVRATWGALEGRAAARHEALDAMLLRGNRTPTVPDVVGRLVRAQLLIIEADSLLTSGNLEGFGRVFAELKSLLADVR